MVALTLQHFDAAGTTRSSFARRWSPARAAFRPFACSNARTNESIRHFPSKATMKSLCDSYEDTWVVPGDGKGNNLAHGGICAARGVPRRAPEGQPGPAPARFAGWFDGGSSSAVQRPTREYGGLFRHELLEPIVGSYRAFRRTPLPRQFLASKYARLNELHHHGIG